MARIGGRLSPEEMVAEAHEVAERQLALLAEAYLALTNLRNMHVLGGDHVEETIQQVEDEQRRIRRRFY